MINWEDLPEEYKNDFNKEYGGIMGRTHSVGEIFDLVEYTIHRAVTYHHEKVVLENCDFTYYIACKDCKNNYQEVDLLDTTEFICDECLESIKEAEEDEKELKTMFNQWWRGKL
jgi:hypothetical protein